MNEYQGKKVQDFDKSIPGCMGKMVNHFDLSPSMAGNRLLKERAHRDGSPLKGRLDVTKKVLDPIGDHIDNKPITNDLKKSSSNKKSNGTPMKMLIAQEMSNQMESKQKPPSVVARLMGLDSFPAQQPVSTLKKSLSEGCLRNASTKQGSVPRHRLQGTGLLEQHHRSQSYSLEQPGYKDVYEVWQQSTKSGFVKDQPRQKGKQNENANERKMALVRQKFIEAKRLATDEKLRQSKEFQDALDVLSSNKDLFLKFLQEPNSLFSKRLYELQSIPPQPQTKRITVLKPSKTLEINKCIGPETKFEKQIKKQHQAVELNEWDNNWPSWDSVLAHQKDDNSSQPTRIVVLKPSPGKTHDIKGMVSSPTLIPRLPRSKGFYGEYETDAWKESREIAKEITRQMQESLSGDQSDEALLPFVLSNGYVGDESNRSENEYIEEGNLSDSEIMTPTSRHSWDYNRYGSPYSTSSLSRTSYTSESSVTREAKKRLSERWAMMTSTGSSQEHRQVRRSSSTLGEMLALSDMKKPVKSGEEVNNEGSSVSSSRSCGGEQELRGPRTRLSNHVDKDESVEHSPRNLSRSRSVPVSSMEYEKVGLNIEAPDSKVNKSIVSKEVAKPKSSKSSLKGKVSSLFFSRNKKPSKEKAGPSTPDSSQVGSQLLSAELLGTSHDLKQRCAEQRTYDNLEGGTKCLEEGKSFNVEEPSCKSSVGPDQQILSSEASLSLSKPQPHENSSENQDQPSPISVLDVRFEDDVNTLESSEIVNGNSYELPAHLCHKSESTAKCPLESVARTLSWDENSSLEETSTPVVLEPSIVPSKAVEEEQQWFLFVQGLLLAAGLEHERSDRVFTRWHSPESPLDPSLLEKFMDQKEDIKQLNEAKRRQRRSDYRLLFDCVNAALVDMVKCGSRAIPMSSACCKWVTPDASVTEEVWVRVREWLSGQAKWFSSETDTSLLIEREVRKEVVERWMEMMGLEIGEIGKKIEGKLLEELVEESLADFSCWLL